MCRENSYKEQMETRGGVYNLYDAFGSEVGSGWLEILRSLCMEITACYEAAGQPVDIKVDQVKEKFEKLRFYYHHKNHDPGIHAIDVLGELVSG